MLFLYVQLNWFFCDWVELVDPNWENGLDWVFWAGVWAKGFFFFFFLRKNERKEIKRKKKRKKKWKKKWKRKKKWKERKKEKRGIRLIVVKVDFRKDFEFVVGFVEQKD